jgi:hypothetical protein
VGVGLLPTSDPVLSGLLLLVAVLVFVLVIVIDDPSGAEGADGVVRLNVCSHPDVANATASKVINFISSFLG